MKNFFLFVFIFLIIGCLSVNADDDFNLVLDNAQVYYSPSNSMWALNEIDSDDKIVFEKKLINAGSGSYSIYKNKDDASLAFALATDVEIVKNNMLIIIDNNLLKFYKLLYKNNRFEQILLSDDEIEKIFPNREILKISLIDEDNKIWLNKPFNKKKQIVLLNDTDKSLHGLYSKTKDSQNENIKSLIDFNRYGIYKFNHFGEYKGKIIFYIR